MVDRISQHWRRLLLALLAAVAFAAVSASGWGDDGEEGTQPVREAADGRRADPAREPHRGRCLDPRSLREAKRFAAGREGSVGFAFLDECGRLVGAHRNRVFPSASVVKVMLLAAYLRQEGVSHRDLGSEERDLLTAMITMSDNDAADDVFASVGEVGLNDVARAAGMANFVPSPFWGGSGITAADQAAFVGRLERYVPKRHEAFAAGLLRRIIPGQTWGVADVRPKGWRLGFKGGWYMSAEGWRVSQVARLTNGKRSFALAVLTDQNPSFQYGRETITGVAKRLMEEYRR